MSADANLIAAIAAVAAVLVSVVAAYISLRADARSKVAARTQVYLTLRSRFIEVHSQLPPSYNNPGWRPESESERAAATRYWHHAFDEWYITTKLDPALLSDLWDNFFSGAVVSGLRHNGLRLHLLEFSSTKGEHDVLWKEFAAVLEQAWIAKHPKGQGACAGLRCAHSTEA